ncbi:MAG: hypothetical protein R2769_00815 [Saprospiraceae bacterium]
MPPVLIYNAPEHNAYVVINQFKENGGMDKGFSIVREYNDMVWSFPEPLKIDGYETRSEGVNVNMSVDGEVLVLSVDRWKSMVVIDLLCHSILARVLQQTFESWFGN